MSQETHNPRPNTYSLLHQDSDHHNLLSQQGFYSSFPTNLNHNHYPFIYDHHLQNPSDQFHTHHDLSFLPGSSEFITTPFNLSNDCSLSGVVSCSNNNNCNNSNEVAHVIRDAAENPPTPNSSGSFSSPEAGVDEESSSKGKKDLQLKVCEGGDGKSKKLKGKKTKEEKKVREARFAFMTKSEVDNLEDGYRWRKYGQKAVKNSPFPRSYYRCTGQKCNVKKRIERSHEDPSVVITTYEGQHNHHSPATIRGGAAAFLAPPLLSAPPAFPIFPAQDLFSPSTTTQHFHPNSNYYMQLPDHDHYSLLFPNMLSSFIHNPHP
ncbi:WRKY transcription factor 71 [Sesamum alatum]|uniref:WRKY transcription factor 71 n=1 Tax=Sesamum alatum TaxID=300844 RepID=A0AAE1Z090_9LAMI|nr:WRKY transcription factor 71 [Sesamum alatum]